MVGRHRVNHNIINVFFIVLNIKRLNEQKIINTLTKIIIKLPTTLI